MQNSQYLAIQTIEISEGKVQDFAAELAKAKEGLLSQQIAGLNYLSGGFVIQGTVPTFQLFGNWQNKEHLVNFGHGNQFFKERLAHFQSTYSKTPIKTEVIRLFTSFDKFDSGKVLEVFTLGLKKQRTEQFRASFGNVVNDGIAKAPGFIRSVTGLANESADIINVFVLILWDTLESHHNFQKSESYPATVQGINTFAESKSLHHVKVI